MTELDQLDQDIRRIESRLSDVEDSLREAREREDEVSAEIAERVAASEDADIADLRRQRRVARDDIDDYSDARDRLEEKLDGLREERQRQALVEADAQANALAEEAVEAGEEALRAAVEAAEAYAEWLSAEREAEDAWQTAERRYRDVTGSENYAGSTDWAGTQKAAHRLGIDRPNERRTVMQALEQIVEIEDPQGQRRPLSEVLDLE